MVSATDSQHVAALAMVVGGGAGVVVLGLARCADDCWTVLARSAVAVHRVHEVAEAVRNVKRDGGAGRHHGGQTGTAR